MNHVLELLNEYEDATLREEDRRRVNEHLAECRECRNELEGIRSLKARTAELPKTIQPERDLWNGIESRIAPAHGIVLPLANRNRRFVSRRLPRLLAIAALLAFGALGIVWLRFYLAPSWKMELVRNGSSSSPATSEETIKVGEVLRTDGLTHATIEVGTIGHVDVEPNSVVRLIEATITDHRLALERGTIHATIFAPPRLFFVETPSALAVDLGCAYTLSVDNSGGSLLEVTSGWVSLEYGGRESVIPAGAMCATRTGFGPGTPFQRDASEELKTALATYDFGLADSASLATILNRARNIDSITLWHLLFRTSGMERERVYDRLAALVPPPDGVTRQGMLSGDPAMIKLWQKHLNLGASPWWKFWQNS